MKTWEEKGGFITATSALGTGVDFPGVVFVLHVGVRWSMIDYAQESGRGGRAGEVTDSVIIVEQGAVERRLANSNGSADVQAIGHFIQTSGRRRGAMSEYLDGNRVECGDVDSTGCDRCGEGAAEWHESNSRWGWERDRVQTVLDELTRGCAVCWVLGDSILPAEGDIWASHDTRDCRRYEGMTDGGLKQFRGLIRYHADTHSCMKCGISQVYCATGDDIREKCQWGFVLTPVVRSAIAIQQGVDIIQEVGFTGDLSGNLTEYARWLGQRYGSRVWGEVFSNAMVVCIRLILFLTSR